MLSVQFIENEQNELDGLTPAVWLALQVDWCKAAENTENCEWVSDVTDDVFHCRVCKCVCVCDKCMDVSRVSASNHKSRLTSGMFAAVFSLSAPGRWLPDVQTATPVFPVKVSLCQRFSAFFWISLLSFFLCKLAKPTSWHCNPPDAEF